MNTMNFAYNIILLLIKNYTIVREHKNEISNCARAQI